MSHPLFIMIFMTTQTENATTSHTTNIARPDQPQLLLVTDTAHDERRWALDEETREAGRRGLAKARAALQATRPHHLEAAA